MSCLRPRPASSLLLTRTLIVFGCLAPFSNEIPAPAFSAEILAIVPRDLVGAIDPWMAKRNAEGLRVHVMRPQATAEATRRTIQDAWHRSTRYVVLFGDAPAVQSHPDLNRQIPTHYRPTFVTKAFGSTTTFATDWPYADRNDDGVPDAALGRVPVSDPRQLASLLERIDAYESSDDFGPWRRSIQLTGGVGGFGGIVDTAIESVTRNMLTACLPTEVKPQIAYASPGHPMCPPGDDFRAAVVERFQKGAQFWVYAGHGRVTQLDLLRRVEKASRGPALSRVQAGVRGDWNVESLFTSENANLLSTGPQRAPIALLLACYAGAFDAHVDSIGESILFAPGGPVSVIAATRVTMPYGNARFTLGLMRAAYPDKEARVRPIQSLRLGDIVVQAMTELHDDTGVVVANDLTTSLVDSLATVMNPSNTTIGDERREHAELYQLLGDPTLKIRQPKRLELSVEKTEASDNALATSARHRLDIAVRSPIDGRIFLTIDRSLGAKEPQPGIVGVLAPEDPKSQSSSWEFDAHQRTIASKQLRVAAGSEHWLSIAVPNEVTGQVTVRGHVEGEADWATAAQRVVLVR
ncbi:MAG: C25 family cysteine peptidase [Planctomycetota bacterium]